VIAVDWVGFCVLGDFARQFYSLSIGRAGCQVGLASAWLLLCAGSVHDASALNETRTLSFHHTHSGEDLAITFKREGRYDEAAGHLREVLKQYPRDRVVHDDLGRTLFLQRRYTDAIAEFQSTLSIDPEDLEANYNLMLCYTGLNEPDPAAEFQKRYLRFKADEAAQTLTGPYRRNHPEDNLERQPIHEHVSEPLATPKTAPKKYATSSTSHTHTSAPTAQLTTKGSD